MHIELFTTIATMLNFIILFLIVNHYLYKPVNQSLENRNNEIANRIKNSEENEKKAEALRIENEDKLKNAYSEGKSIVESYKVKAEDISKEIVSKANSEAGNIVEKGKKELELEIQKANDEIKTQVVDLAVLLSSQALGESIDETQHRRLIEEFIAKVGM